MKQGMVRVLGGIVIAAFGLVPLGAAAQSAPTHGDAPVPSYAQPSAPGTETIKGTITGFSGKYGVTLRDERGFVDNVQMHQGTIINPNGISLQKGMPVSIVGRADGLLFLADEVDTPYPASAVPPYYIGVFGSPFYTGFGGRWYPRYPAGYYPPAAPPPGAVAPAARATAAASAAPFSKDRAPDAQAR